MSGKQDAWNPQQRDELAFALVACDPTVFVAVRASVWQQ
jgi:hypothetical protein